MLSMLLLLEFCYYITTHDLGLGLQLLVLHSETGTAATTAAGTATAAQPRRRMKTLRSELLWHFVVVAVDGKDTRLHWQHKISSDDATSRTKHLWSCDSKARELEPHMGYGWCD